MLSRFGIAPGRISAIALTCLFAVSPEARAEEGLKTILEPVDIAGMEFKTLSPALVEAALAQAPPPPRDGYAATGSPVLIGRSYTGRFHASTNGWGGCFPEDGHKCISAPERTTGTQQAGAQGWCNPPFLNIAIANAVEYGDDHRTLSLAHSDAEQKSWRLSSQPDLMGLRYDATTMAQFCQGGYIAVIDQFWEGFDLPIRRVVMHLGSQFSDLAPYPECYKEGKPTWACSQSVLSPYGTSDLPQTFEAVSRLFETPPPSRRLDAAPLSAAAAPPPPSFAPYFEVMSAQDGRRGIVHHGWNDARVEIACAIGDFGSMKGRPYVMVTAPIDQLKNFGEMAVFAEPGALHLQARVSIRTSPTRGSSSPLSPPAVSGLFDRGSGERFGFVIDLSSHPVRSYVERSLREPGQVIQFSAVLFPEEGDAVFSYQIKEPDAGAWDLRKALEDVMRSCT